VGSIEKAEAQSEQPKQKEWKPKESGKRREGQSPEGAVREEKVET